MSDVELSWFIDDTLSRALQAEKGVAQIRRVGGTTREINVVLDLEQPHVRLHHNPAARRLR